jgi:hypothetical protein
MRQKTWYSDLLDKKTMLMKMGIMSLQKNAMKWEVDIKKTSNLDDIY